MPPLGKSDHETLIISLDLPKYDRKKGKIKYKYSKTDFKGMREHLSLVDWDKINNMSLNDAWDFFKQTMYTSYELYVPKEVHQVNSKPVWMDKKSMKSIKKKI